MKTSLIEPKFKGSKKRRFFQYLDSIGMLFGIIVVYYILDTAVEWLYSNNVADTQSAAQRFTFEDVEGMILAGLMLAFGITLAKLILEIIFDSYHFFFESDKDASWTSYKAFRKLEPHHQWYVVSILSSASFIAYALILTAIT